MREYTKCGLLAVILIISVFSLLTAPATASSDMSELQSCFEYPTYANGYELQNSEYPKSIDDMNELIKNRVKRERTSGMESSGYNSPQMQEIGVQGYLIISGNYTTLWNESLVANYTYAVIVSDMEGDGNPDVLVHTRRYDPATNIETARVIAKKGIDGMQLWVETVTATGENNCDLFAFPVGDLDGDGLDDVIITKEKKELTEKAERIIAKKGSDGTFFWEETVNASGSGYCNIDAYCAGDLDGDGLNDVIVTKSQSDWVAGTDREEILVKKGKEGTLLWNMSLSGITCDIGVYCAGDLDGDGLDDVILSEWQQGADTSTAKIVANKGKDGTLIWDELVGTREYFTYDWADCPDDLDGDGVDDVIVTEWYYNGILFKLKGNSKSI